MWIIIRLRDDSVRLPPHNLDVSRVEALASALEACYVGCVLPSAGLAVALNEIAYAEESGMLSPGDGGPRFEVHFSLLVLQPFIGEVLVARLIACDCSGLRLRLGSVSGPAIFVPAHALQHPSEWVAADRLWIWRFDESTLHIDLGAPVRLRVTAVRFPASPKAASSAALVLGEGRGGGHEHYTDSVVDPMVIEGTINEDGLGLLEWWL